MALSLSAISQARYQTGVLVSLSKWLAYYLGGTEYTAAWAQVGGGVTVYAEKPQTPAEEALAQPRVVLSLGGEESHAQTLAEADDPDDPGETANFNCTYLRLNVEAECFADDNTGAAMTCYDLASAVRRICEMHGGDLASAGLLYVSARPGETTLAEDTDLWIGTVTITVEFALLGQRVS